MCTVWRPVQTRSNISLRHGSTVCICSLALTRHDFTVIPSEDCHASEYIAAHDARREYISGFTGSAGCAVVTLDKAVLATDGRYFSQALKELDSNWQLLKQGTQDVPTWQEWSATEAAGSKTVAVDPTLISASAAAKLAEKVKRAGGAQLRPLEGNLVDLVWVAGRPDRPSNPALTHPSKFAGKGVEDKLSELRRDLAKKNSLGLVVSELDEVAWLFNLRGFDIPYNPIFFSYAIVTPDSAVIYIDKGKLDADTRAHLDKSGITVKPYEDIFADIKTLSDGQKQPEAGSDAQPAQFAISNKASWALKLAFGEGANVEEVRSPICDAKAIKNATEVEGMKACHVRDGAALIEYFSWLEDQLLAKKAVLDEVAAADKLEELRKGQENYVGLSFNTISSTGPK